MQYKNSKKRYRIGIPLCLILLVWYIFCLPSPLFEVPYSTVVTDRHHEILGARIAADEQWRFPESDSVPEKYKICLIEFEDKHFYRHWGVNPLAVGRAVQQNFSQRRIVSGASTITMQTIRLSRNESRTFGEKFIEVILATRLEFKYSKDEILNLYASHAPMGGNVVGIEAASWRYFGHNAADLSWAEAATLAILPNSPAMMHFGKNRDKLLTKRNRLLDKLYSKGILSEIDHQLAIAEPLPPRPLALPQIAPHLVTRLYGERKGQNIASTIDKYLQERTESVLSRWNAEFAQNGIKNIAALIIDIDRNEILSYCGNVDFESNISGNQVDIIQAPRSTGSILKPVLYCAMLDNGQLLPDELLGDIPVNLNGFSPKNFSQHFDGAVPASDALARSLNVPFVLLLRKYSIPKFHDLLKKSGMTTLNRSPRNYGLSLILGGAEGRLWDISGIYLQMAQTLNDYNEGSHYYEYIPPAYILDESKAGQDRERITQPLFSAGAIYQTFNALTNVNRPEEIDWRSIPSIQKIAWKTGTSFGFRDGWAIGVNSGYLVAVWVGNADGEGRPGLTGARTAGMVMFDIFGSLPRRQWFSTPTDLVPTEVCRKSGLLKGINCPPSSVDTLSLTRKGLNADACAYHKLVHLSEDRRYQVYQDCAGSRGIVHESWFVLPPSWERFYKEQHPAYKALPPYSPECSKESSNRLIEFLYPFPNMTISIPRQLDGSEGQVVFEIAHRSPRNKVFWHIDNEYIGETQNIHKKEFRPTRGEHRLTVVDETGERTSIKFTVK